MTIVNDGELLLLLILVGVNYAATTDQSIQNNARVLFDSTSRMECSYTFRSFGALNLDGNMSI